MSRQQWQENPAIFNERIRERLIDNPHRLASVLSPDRDKQAKTDAELVGRMKAIRAQFTDEQVKHIAADAAELERLNAQPNSPEALAKLPQLQVSDLPEKPRHIPTTVENIGGRPLLRNDVFANGVNYLVLKLRFARVTGASLALSAEIYRCYFQTRCRRYGLRGGSTSDIGSYGWDWMLPRVQHTRP